MRNIFTNLAYTLRSVPILTIVQVFYSLSARTKKSLQDTKWINLLDAFFELNEFQVSCTNCYNAINVPRQQFRGFISNANLKAVLMNIVTCSQIK